MKYKMIIQGMIIALFIWMAYSFLFLTISYPQNAGNNPEETNLLELSTPADYAMNDIHAGPIIIDHRCIDLSEIPQNWISSIKEPPEVLYFHDDSGKQPVAGIRALQNGPGPFPRFIYSANGYHADYNAWAAETRDLLTREHDKNRKVVMWSWRHEDGIRNADDVFTYLALMDQLEQEFPEVTFVYMTGSLDGSGPNGDLNQSNERIRRYCLKNNKVLFDSADIESYDPDGLTNYMFLLGNDNGDYDSDGDGLTDRNWSLDWMERNPDHALVKLADACGGGMQPQKLQWALKNQAFWGLMAGLSARYKAAQATYTISGTITYNGNGLSGVTLYGLPGEPATNGSGEYSATVDEDWSGTATPGLTGYVFTPTSRSYNNVGSDQTNQDYTAAVTPTYTISGRITMDGDGSDLPYVKMYGLPGEPETNQSGYYTATINQGWSGDVDPERSGYFFSPHKRSYSNVNSNQINQDYGAWHVLEANHRYCFIGTVCESSPSRFLNTLRVFLDRWLMPHAAD